MKILYLIGYPPKYAAENLQEIIEYSVKLIRENHGAPINFNNEFYQMVKSLELNEAFEQEVVKSRKRLKIPLEGYDWQEYLKMTDHKRGDLTNEELQKLLFLIKETPKEVARISRKLKLASLIVGELKEIILTSSVSSPEYLADLHYWLEPDDSFFYMDKDEREEAKEITKSFNIAFTRQVSKNELIKFIEDNWDYIKERIKILPKKVPYYITDRDLRIVELRDKHNMTFRQIVNKIIDEFEINDITGKINEDSIKNCI